MKKGVMNPCKMKQTMNNKKKRAGVVELAPQTADMLARCIAYLRPPPVLTLSQWADKYRVLSAETNNGTARWHTDNAPYQREIMDAIEAAYGDIWEYLTTRIEAEVRRQKNEAPLTLAAPILGELVSN